MVLVSAVNFFLAPQFYDIALLNFFPFVVGVGPIPNGGKCSKATLL